MPTYGDKPDLRTRETKAAQDYMAKKGYPQIRPLGVIPIPGMNCWYFYYKLPEGLLELEVESDSDNRRFERRVAAFVTDPDRVQHLLAS